MNIELCMRSEDKYIALQPPPNDLSVTLTSKKVTVIDLFRRSLFIKKFLENLKLNKYPPSQ